MDHAMDPATNPTTVGRDLLVIDHHLWKARREGIVLPRHVPALLVVDLRRWKVWIESPALQVHVPAPPVL